MRGKNAFPERTSIAIVGGGLGGFAVAAALGDAARDAVLLDAGDAADAHDASLGFARATPALPLARLAAGHGAESAARWIAAGRRNRELLIATGVPIRFGVVRLAPAGEPADELRRSTEFLGDLGGEARIAAPHDLLASTPVRFALAALHPEDGVLESAALHRALRDRATDCGLAVLTGVRVESLLEDGDVRLETTRGTLHAEIAIVATGFELSRLVPFCRFKVVGMRAQWLEARRRSERQASGAAGWTDAEGYERWREVAPDLVRVGGSRDLPVRREIAARDGTSDEVQALLERNLHEFPHLASSPVVRRGASVQAVPCDGIPLAGPVPGRPRVYVLGAFGCESPGMALVAGETVAEMVLTGRAAHALAYSPRRFL